VDVLSWSAWTGNVIALGGLAYTWWTGRGAKRAAAAANQRAEESLTAAQEAAAAQQRMAEVLEKMYEAQEHRATTNLRAAPSADAVDAEPPWLLQRTREGAYRLTNAGTRTLHDVRTTVSGSVRLGKPQLHQGRDWSPGESADFAAVVSWQTDTPQLVVTWGDATGDRRRWVRVIPR